jgi:hypothetical protein
VHVPFVQRVPVSPPHRGEGPRIPLICLSDERAACFLAC